MTYIQIQCKTVEPASAPQGHLSSLNYFRELDTENCANVFLEKYLKLCIRKQNLKYLILFISSMVA